MSDTESTNDDASASDAADRAVASAEDASRFGFWPAQPWPVFIDSPGLLDLL